MPTAKVYSPLYGVPWNEDYYSDGTLHTVVHCRRSVAGHCCPTDVGGRVDALIRFWANQRVKSIRTQRIERCCRAEDQSSRGPWHQGVLVRAYRDRDGREYIGEVLYLHLTNRIGNIFARIDNSFPDAPDPIVLGRLPPDECFDPTGREMCSCRQGTCCSHGVHIHMQAAGPGLKAVRYLDREDREMRLGRSTIYKWHWNW